MAFQPIDELYDIGPLLGRGGFAVVHSARCRLSGARVALKVIDTARLSEEERKRVDREIDVHATVSREAHPHVVRLLDQHEDSERVYLVLEHCPHGDLYKLLRRSGPLEEEPARNFVRQLLLGLAFLHERNVVHRYASPLPPNISHEALRLDQKDRRVIFHTKWGS